MPLRRIVWMVWLGAPVWLALRAAPPAQPELVSMFPFGGQPGTSFQATIRGRSLDHVTLVWFDCEHLSATITGVKADPAAASGSSGSKRKKGSSAPAQLLSIDVMVGPDAAVGTHSMRIVTPGGVSNDILVRIHAEPAVLESGVDHSVPAAAQPISTLPAVITGKLTGGGELDYYAVEAREGETLRFDGLSSGTGLDPSLTLFELTGSWFRQDRLTELAFHDDEVWYPGLPAHARITYKFAKTGRFLIRVSGFLGEGRADNFYQLCIRRTSDGPLEADAMRPAHLTPASSDLSWRERTWKRELKPDRLTALWARTAGTADEKAPPEIAPLRLTGQQPVPVSLPALLEGTIERPAQVHRVKFSVKANDRIALEVETLRATIPEFNPYLRIVSVSGDEAFTNVHSTVNTCGDTILKQIQPKTTYSFPRAGEFILEIRDITHTYAGPDFAYRVFLRRQVPHVGEVRSAEEQINLVAGDVTKLSVQTDQEEGFDGQIALTVEGLPEGVRATMGTDVEPKVPPPYNPGKVERFQPESQKATFLFLTDDAAPATSRPVEARIVARPVVKGKLGAPLTVKKILVTVVRAANQEASQ